MDGGDDQSDSPQEESTDLEVAAEAENLLDDETAGDEVAPDLDFGDAEGGWLIDSAEADSLDIGASPIDITEEPGLLEDNEEPGVGEEEFGLGGESEKVTL